MNTNTDTSEDLTGAATSIHASQHGRRHVPFDSIKNEIEVVAAPAPVSMDSAMIHQRPIAVPTAAQYAELQRLLMTREQELAELRASQRAYQLQTCNNL